MATRSIIARKLNDKESMAIYCHYDGYLEHNGMLLELCYNTPEKVEKLISLGDLCCLEQELEPDPTKAHTRLRPQKGVSIYYGRDTQSADSEPVIVETDQLGNLSNWIEHVYWFDGKEWKHSNIYDNKKLRFKSLKRELQLIKPYIDLIKQMKGEKSQPTLE